MTAFVDDGDQPVCVTREARKPGQTVLVVTPPTGSVLNRAIIEALASASYVTAEVDPVPTSNIFETKYSRQREWWNTPKKERRRKK